MPCRKCCVNSVSISSISNIGQWLSKTRFSAKLCQRVTMANLSKALTFVLEPMDASLWWTQIRVGVDADAWASRQGLGYPSMSLSWNRLADKDEYLVLRCLRIAQPAFGRFFGQADRLTQSYTVLQSNMCELVEIMMRWWWPCPDVNIPNLVTIADLAWLCRFASFFHDTVWFACFILCQVRMTPVMNASHVVSTQPRMLENIRLLAVLFETALIVP